MIFRGPESNLNCRRRFSLKKSWQIELFAEFCLVVEELRSCHENKKVIPAKLGNFPESISKFACVLSWSRNVRRESLRGDHSTFKKVQPSFVRGGGLWVAITGNTAKASRTDELFCSKLLRLCSEMFVCVSVCVYSVYFLTREKFWEDVFFQVQGLALVGRTIQC